MELEKGNFCLKGHIDVPTERVDLIKEALVDHIALTRDEPGCIYFNVDQCSEVSGRFLVSEAFVDEAAFQLHQERASKSPWAEISKGFPREYKTWFVE